MAATATVVTSQPVVINMVVGEGEGTQRLRSTSLMASRPCPNVGSSPDTHTTRIVLISVGVEPNDYPGSLDKPDPTCVL
jgi:hypothetical protein